MSSPLPSKNQMGIWIRNYLRHPLQVGAILPSGNSLSSLMTARVRISSPEGYVVELGPGTGSFTRALVSQGVPQNRLILIESSKEFVSYLKQVYPAATVVHGNAADIGYHLRLIGIRTVDHVVSGVPLVSCNKETRERICDAVLNSLNSGGSFVQVTYFWMCPIPQRIIRNYNAKRIFSGVAKWNMPPGFVWRVEKP